MLQRSPILRFALEVFEHALESVTSERARDRKLAVINLAQCVELAIKAALVDKNVSIYLKEGRTISAHDALAKLAELRGVQKIATHARLELLVDERNAIQHRYGDVDEVTLDYHVETVFDTLEELLRQFDIDLSDWIRDTVDAAVWTRIRFVKAPEPEPQQPSQARQPDRSPTLDLVDGFSRYEEAIRKLVQAKGGRSLAAGSTLDFAIKTLAALDPPPAELIQELPGVYKLRNRVIHGEDTAEEAAVGPALSRLDEVLKFLGNAPDDLIQRALETVRWRVRGARVLSRAEIGELEAELLGKEAMPPEESGPLQ